MFRASSAHLQEDTVVHMRHMVLSLSTRVHGGLSDRPIVTSRFQCMIYDGGQITPKPLMSSYLQDLGGEGVCRQPLPTPFRRATGR